MPNANANANGEVPCDLIAASDKLKTNRFSHKVDHEADAQYQTLVP